VGTRRSYIECHGGKSIASLESEHRAALLATVRRLVIDGKPTCELGREVLKEKKRKIKLRQDGFLNG